MTIRNSILSIALALALAACAVGAPAPTPTSTPVPVPVATIAPSAVPTVPPVTVTAAPVAVTSTLDVTYTVALTSAANSFALDTYAPAASANAPVVVFLPGTGENRRGYARFSRELAEAGFVVYTADWPIFASARGAQDHGRGYREALEAVACAVRYARATAAAFGGDVKRLTLAGHSAGAGIAALLAFQGDQPEALWKAYEAEGGPPPQTKCVKTADSAHVDALIANAGPYGSADALRASQPQLADLLLPPHRFEVRKDLRVRLLHSPSDSVVPIASSRLFAAALAGAGLDVKLIEHTGAHAVPVPLFIDTLRQLWN